MEYAMSVLKVFADSWQLAFIAIVMMIAFFVNWNIRRMVRSEERKSKDENKKAIELARINRKEIAVASERRN